jgi:hypothetical protein
VAKLKRYDSFQSLKVDAEPEATDVQQSKSLHEEMEQFIAILRNSIVEKKVKEKKISNPSDCNDQ